MLVSHDTMQRPQRPLSDLELVSRAVAVSHGRTLLNRGPASPAMVFIVEGEAEVVIREPRADGGSCPDELVCGRLYAGQSAGAFGLLGLRPRRLASVRTRGPAVVRILDEGGWTWLCSQDSSLEAEIRAQAERDLHVHVEVLCRLVSRMTGRVTPGCAAEDSDFRGLTCRLGELEGQLLGTETDLLFYDQLRMLELAARGAAGAV